MKTTRIHTFLLIVLFGLVLYQSFMNGGTVRQAKELTHSLEVQLDSLQVIYENYQRIHDTYVDVYQQLVFSQHRATTLSTELARISSGQQADVAHIRQELHQLLTKYDTLSLEPFVSTPLNEFQP